MTSLRSGGEVPVAEPAPLATPAPQAVFARPVIALGSDFGTPDAQQKLPFRLERAGGACPVPGKFRWVTTTIARFDPDVDWPTDLDCSLVWNTGLTSYDGAPLQLGDVPTSKRLINSPLLMYISGVTSAGAQALTDNMWSSLPTGDGLREVPPDGKILLHFSHPVNLVMLQSVLRVAEKSGTQLVPVDVGPCQSAAPWLPPAQVASSTSSASGLSLDVNTTCAEVLPKTALKAATDYLISIPKGARYHALAGPLMAETLGTVTGLRPFTFMFQNGFFTQSAFQGTSYRRLDLWLIHGLSSGTTADALAAQLELCELPRCTKVDFKLSLPARGRARLSVETLKPGTQYRLAVTGSDSVKDGYGQGLRSGSFSFWTSYINFAFTSPQLYSSLVATLEAGVESLSAWPFITRGAPPVNPNGYISNMPLRVDSWELDLKDAKAQSTMAKLFQQAYQLYQDSGFITLLGQPRASVDVPKELRTPGSTADWQELRVPLAASGTKAQILVTAGTALAVYDTPRFLVNSSLSLSVLQSGRSLTAWVLDAAVGGGPLAGAAVSFYYAAYGYSGRLEEPVLAAKCTTNEDGVCTASTSASDDNHPLVAFAVAGSRVAVLPSAGYTRAPSPPPSFSGALVADRLVVVPGDSLKVTGFVQQASPSGLKLPASTYAFLELDGSTGTLHAEIPVPVDATPQPYTVMLRVPDSAVSLSASTPASSAADNWPSASGVPLNIVVSDPRPPTADLKVETPPWILPTGSAAVKMTAVSYVGASVGGAVMTLTWRTAMASGVVPLTTDAGGVAATTIDLGALPPANRSTAPDTLSVDVEWIGPTRERITRSASVHIADGPARLDLSLSLSTDLPGVAFAPSATLTSNVDGSPLPGIPVTFRLRPDPNDTAGVQCTTEVSCSAPSGAGPTGNCQLVLPCVGRFRLEACADVRAGAGAGTARVCGYKTLGRNATEWALAPLSAHDTPVLLADKTAYSLGETVKLRLQNPWPAARLLLQWGNTYAVATKAVRTMDAGLAEVTIGPLGDECMGGCNVVAALDVPRVETLPSPLPPPDQLLVSRLFDPRAPHTHTLSLSLVVRPDNTLNVSVAVSSATAAGGAAGGVVVRDVDGKEVLTIEPGAEAQISVSVKSGPLATDPVPAAGSVEVTVYAVDKAFLDLLPYDLPQPQQEVVLRLAADISRYGVEAYRVAPGAVRAVYDKLMARLTGLDPWLPVDTSVTPGNGHYYWGAGRAAVDTNDTAYLAAYGTSLTYMPSYNYVYESGLILGGAMAGSSAADMITSVNAALPVVPPMGGAAESSKSFDQATSAAVSGGSTASRTSGATVSVRQEADFVVTPLFTKAVTDANGKAIVSFKAPQNLGTFVIRAFAAAGSVAKYGAAEGKVAVRRLLSLTPSVPRFVRVGDAFEAGVVVTVGSAPATVTVTLQLGNEALDPLTLTGPTTKTVSFTAEGGLQQEVRFSFTAAAIGNASLSFTASDSQPEGGQDALSLEIPVEGQQGAVWVATSFALSADAASGSGDWQEGMQLPDAVPGSGGLALSAGVGYFPSVNATYDNLLLTEDDRPEPVAGPAVMWATLPAVLSYYSQSASEALGAEVKAAFKDLERLSNGQYGLMWHDPSRWGWDWRRVDVSLNTWAMFLAAQHGKAMGSLPPALSAFSEGWKKVSSDLLPGWRSAVERQLVYDAIEARSSLGGRYPYSDWHSLAWARLVLGASWEPQNVDNQIRQDLSLDALLGATKEMGMETKAVLCLLLQSMGGSNPDPKLLSTTLNEITSALRTQGRTAYVAVAPGSASAASLSEQALCLLLLLRSGATHQLLPKLAAYVANPARSSTGWGAYWLPGSWQPSWTERALAVAALTEYDQVRGSSQPEVDLEADANGLTVLTAGFHSGGNTAPVSNVTAWEDVPAAPAGQTSELSFEVTGRGEVSVAASLHFVPTALLSYPIYRGMYVEAALQMADPLTGRPVGQRLKSVPLGSSVVLTVQLTTPDDLGAVTLDVMMPGGLEPLDPNIAAGVEKSCGASWVDDSSWSYFYRWWYYPMCPSQETRPSRVTFSYAGLSAGTSTVTIRAVAATAGTFVLPPVRAFAELQPELMGSTAAGSVTICADCTAPTYGTAAPPPNACPADCNGNGVCNLKTGRCRCDPGYTRSDCSRPVA
ncbi:hypothetical protein GPECTOR_2g1337 [Gonium pectorale]|uniref:EGF-like domain-containing protein n=1 Tax=Gonium pectorale TaxID=33097 RepID=A0A150H0U7_GONPE|nr:hypothetical protein GPECTOR_2g1337 [Gonium pectorale]|eukprot:KXZ55787.1 hypothetical protein GPECTOR_2g1337 [Gonium pectorale]